MSGKKSTVLLTIFLLVSIASGYSYTNTGFRASWFATDDGSFNTSTGTVNISNASGVLPRAQHDLYTMFNNSDNNMNGKNITNVTNFTAKNVGGVIYADRYPSIQDAINASGGLPVYIPCGIYVTSQNVKIKSGQEFFGAGECSVIKLADNALMNLSNTFAIVINENTTTVGTSPTRHDTDIHLHDFVIDGNGYNQTPNFSTAHENYIGSGIKFYPVANSTIERLIIKNTIGGGISLYGALYPGYEIATPGNNLVLYNKIVNFGTNQSINRNDIIAGILIDDQGSGLTQVHGNMIQNGSLTALMDEDTRGEITYSFNQINNTFECYRSISSGRITKFINNICDTTIGNGIAFEGSVSHPEIVGNTILYTAMYGIKAAGNTIIRGNTIFYSGGSGIYVANPYCDISQNEIIDSGQNLTMTYRDGITINMSSAAQIKIRGNTIWDDWQQGLNPLTGGLYASQQVGLNFTNIVTTVTSLAIHDNFLKANNVSDSNLSVSILLTNNEISGNHGIQIQVHSGIVEFGNSATAPTAFGAGDTYFNSTADYLCWRNATSWNRYNDSIGGC